jgi:hypothetical protein|tara:strand:+ start:91 stop:276 length:186 start_codon:yes stop_codon:yes gene_type:complete
MENKNMDKQQINELISELKQINSNLNGLLIFAISESNILKAYKKESLLPLIKKYKTIRGLL